MQIFKGLSVPAILISCSLFTFGQQAKNADFYQWAATPPMGWNSWDCYGPTVTEAEVKANADYMSQYLKPFGWEYIVVDIRWYVVPGCIGFLSLLNKCVGLLVVYK